MIELIEAREHYDRLIKNKHDPYHDPPQLQAYMQRWTGEKFWEYLAATQNKDVLEIGVGTGRLAEIVLNNGCHAFTGIDPSDLTIKAARNDLCRHKNVTLIQAHIENYKTDKRYDIIY